MNLKYLDVHKQHLLFFYSLFPPERRESVIQTQTTVHNSHFWRVQPRVIADSRPSVHCWRAREDRTAYTRVLFMTCELPSGHDARRLTNDRWQVPSPCGPMFPVLHHHHQRKSDGGLPKRGTGAGSKNLRYNAPPGIMDFCPYPDIRTANRRSLRNRYAFVGPLAKFGIVQSVCNLPYKSDHPI